MNHFFYIIEILKSIREKHPASAVYCCLPNNDSKMYIRGEGFIQDYERFLGLLARDFCAINRIAFHGTFFTNRRIRFSVYWITKVIRKIGEILAWIHYSSFSNESSKEKLIIIPALSYRMGSLLKEVKQQHPRNRYIMVWEGKTNLKQELFKIYLLLSHYINKLRGKNILAAVICLDLIKSKFPKDAKTQRRIKEELDKLIISNNSELKSLLVYSDIPFGPYLENKIKNGLVYEILSLGHTTMVLRNVLKRLQPNLLLSMYSVGIYYMMGELSRILGFNSLNISHGTHVPPNNEFEKIENYRLGTNVILNTYKHVAVQTPWTEKFLDYYNDKRPRLISGPLLFSIKDNTIRQKKRREILGSQDNVKIIVHASTQKTRYGMRFHIEETLDEYICSLIDIINAIKKLDDIFLVIRPHPVCDITERQFRLMLPDCKRLKIINKGPFSDILSIADLLISYSSTCIEEALQNEIPVILFDRWKRYNHFNIQEIKDAGAIQRSPVYYITEPEVLAIGVPKILELFERNPFADGELANYRYPREFKAHFFSFVDQALRPGGSN
jgi:hypothetical protein